MVRDCRKKKTITASRVDVTGSSDAVEGKSRIVVEDREGNRIAETKAFKDGSFWTPLHKPLKENATEFRVFTLDAQGKNRARYPLR